MRMKKLSTLAAALLLAGCSMIPTYERPAAPVADSFPYSSAQECTPPAQLPVAAQSPTTVAPAGGLPHDASQYIEPPSR